MNNYPSIFNDVIGPVMRGPSSSHCAASLRIGRLCKDLMDGEITHILIEFDPTGSLADTHTGQGSDMGLFGGFLGWEADDERLPRSEKYIAEAGITIEFAVRDIKAAHLNTYLITLTNDKETRTVTSISTGGGMIEVVAIDGVDVSMLGDFYETLIYCKTTDKIVELIKAEMPFDHIMLHNGDATFIQIKAQGFPSESLQAKLAALADFISIKKLGAVLPVLSRKDVAVPYTTCNEMLAYNKDKNLSLLDLAILYERERGNISKEEVVEKMRKIVRILKDSIKSGLQGTEYADRLLGSQSVNYKSALEKNKLVGSGAIDNVVMYVSALMEVKSSMGVIVAAPTAGSCGTLPGAIIGSADFLQVSEDDAVEAMLVSGLIGIFIATQSTFAGEVAGCGVEYGSGGGMAAAAIVYMQKGTLAQSLAAASMVLQSTLGMSCTPIANRVEAPCLGNNIMAATNAVTFANMALSGYDPLLPLDEVIETMHIIGMAIPHEFKCTNIGGLCATKTAKILEAKLNSLN
ncbi:serine dehydratase [Pedobacter changchengzhani]|uniref:L-serine ammonia-lyase n=1 Tax=Pedobacter changchengzhani TaxID=2529274 RepID=A0A4R5MKP7_9SPHI|nr:L-serine ammonia-lyase, iron-sulfur-dependent, subunit alpha [Pedobacter changchengzhani]TDG36250.1 serine dehydratase [Pedobacter changchengzhani]